MRHLIVAAALLAAAPAFAEQPDPMQMATGETLTETLGAMVQWRARAIAEEQQIGVLKKELADARAPKPPTKP